MKNRKTIIRLVCLALMVAMVAPIIASCKRADPVSAAVKEHVYKAEYFPMPEEFTYFNNAVVNGGKVFAVVDSMGEDGSYNQKIVAIDIASGGYESLPFEMKNEYSENSSSYTYVSNMKIDGDGNIILVVNSSTSTMNPATNEWSHDEKFELVTLNADSGAEMGRLDLSTLNESTDEYSYFYVQNAAVVGNYVVVTTGENIYVLDSTTGKKAFDIAFEGWINEMFVSNGRLLLSMYDYSANSQSHGLMELDFNAQSFVDSGINLPGEPYRYTFISGEGYDLYLNDRMSLYGYDVETKEMTELLNWIDSDIDADSLSSISPVSAEEIFCIGYDYSGGRSNVELTRLTKVDPKDVVEKTILTMAVQYLNYDVRRAIIAFNKSNEKYRITVNDYSMYNTEDNYSAGAEKLNTDLISGVVPDIIYVDSYNMPVDSFISKGMFADLYPLMDKDPNFNREDYLQNVFDAYSRDGKLYSIISSFNVYTVMGKASDVGTTMGWTMDDLNAIMAAKPEGMMSFANTSRDSILQMSTFMSLDSFIDKATGRCSFDDGNFAKLLEFAAQFPSQEELQMGYSAAGGSQRTALAVAAGEYIGGGGYDVYISDEERIRNGEALIQMVYLYEYNDYQMKKYAYGEEPTYIGFPTSQGIGSVLMGDAEFALYAKSRNLDGGWEFIKYFLSDEHQSSIEWSFPVKISRLDELAKKAMEPPSYTWTDENGVEHVETYPRTYWIGGQSVEMDDMTQADIDKVNELLFSVNTAMVYDNKVQEIITEEAEAFFNGQRSAQDAAGIVQSRVQTYISENR
ncbi:MAG: extracellular solute-binding protein [Christensenellales bacterium]|jgi:ABC-type glycerol-3-phosphate transport system substrate-binding protein